MADRPIIFSAPMVRALLDGRKTMTRRLAWQDVHVVTSRTVDGVQTGLVVPAALGGEPARLPSPWQRVQPGDRLWVRESGHVLREAYDHDPARGDLYRDAGFQHTADGAIIARRAYDTPLADWIGACARANRPSIHMPRWASRLTLTVTAVRVEPLQDINAGDAIREGIAYPPKGMTMDEACEYGVDPRGEFRSLWAALHGPGAWAANPEVVALTFTVARRNIDHG